MSSDNTDPVFGAAADFILDNPGVVAYMYSGIMFSESDVFPRLDATSAVLVYCSRGIPVVQRVHPYKYYTKENEPRVCFTSAPLFKVLNGARKGRRFLQAGDTRPAESIAELNQVYPLTLPGAGYGRGIPARDAGNLAEDLRLLADSLTAGYRTTLPPVFPTLHQACDRNNSSVFLRNTPEALCFVEGLIGYDSSASYTENLMALRDRASLDAGLGRVAYPYEHIYGSGVVVGDDKDFRIWHFADTADFPAANACCSLHFGGAGEVPVEDSECY